MRFLFIFVFIWKSYIMQGCNSPQSISPLNERIPLDIRNQSVNDVLERIEKQAGITFIYNSDIVEDYLVVYFTIDDASVQEILDLLFGENKIQYKEFKRQIIFKLPEKSKFKPGRIITTQKALARFEENERPVLKNLEKENDNNQQNIHRHTVKYNKTYSHLKNNQLVIPPTGDIGLQIANPAVRLSSDKKSGFSGYEFSIESFFSIGKSSPESHQYSTSLEEKPDTLSHSEKYVFSYAAGIHVNTHYKSWIFKTGLTMNRFRTEIKTIYPERINSAITGYTYFSVVVDSFNRTNPITGVTDVLLVTRVDSVPVFETFQDSKSRETYSTLTYFEIPLALGLSFRISKKLDIEFWGGFNIAFLISQKNFAAKKDENTTDSEDNVSYNSRMYSCNYSIAFNYAIYPKMDIMIIPWYKQNQNYFLKSKNYISDKYKAFGVQFGLRYTF